MNNNISDLSFIEISKSCLNLELIRVYSCVNVTNVGMFAIFENCLKLKKIYGR
jgi:hypothetical protein